MSNILRLEFSFIPPELPEFIMWVILYLEIIWLLQVAALTFPIPVVKDITSFPRIFPYKSFISK